MSTQTRWKNFLLHFLLCHPNRLRQLTWAAWLLTLLSACILADSGGWSAALQKPMSMGFDSGGHNPLLALTLSRDSGALVSILQQEDVCTMKRMLDRDTWFILAYGLLLACLAWRHGPAWARTALAVMVICTMTADFLENQGALRLLNNPGPLAQEAAGVRTFCAWKWGLFFSICGVISVRDWFEPLEGGFSTGIRILVTLLIGTGAFTGLTWLLFQNAVIIENACTFIAAGLLLVPLWIWNPDRRWQ